MAERFELRHYRLIARTPFVEIDGDQIGLRLPSMFGGRRTWRLRARDVAVVVDVEDESSFYAGDWAFDTPVLIPYAATTTSNVRPNVNLLFVTPQRIPPLRVGGAQTIGLPYRQSRGEQGVWVDGLQLRAERPDELTRALLAAGAEAVSRPEAWLRQHRAVTTDPARVAEAKASDRRSRWVAGIAFAAVLLLNGWRFLDIDSEPGWVVAGVGALACVLVFGLPYWARRKAAASARHRERSGT